MKTTYLGLFLALMIVTSSAGAVDSPEPRPLRAAVIGGIVMSGLWTELAEAFTEETGIPIQNTIAGNKEVLIPAFRRGEADVIIMHASDDIVGLVAEGWAQGIRPWGFNDLVIVGPPSDPAKVRGFTSGADALKIIAESGSRFIDPRGSGQAIILNRLFKMSGVTPSPQWFIVDDSPSPYGVLLSADKKNAYTIVGRMPVAFGKLGKGNLEVLVKDDPAMRRPYVVAVANPDQVPTVPLAEALALADFMVSPEGQAIVRHFKGQSPQSAQGPFFYALPGRGVLALGR